MVCNCDGLAFPHRQFSKGCAPEAWVERFFDPHRHDCRDCNNLDGRECQVVNGIETAFNCPELREYVRVEGIMLYGRAKRAYERTRRHAA